MDNDERKKIILDYIYLHETEGCSPESVFDSLSQTMSRQTYFNCLAELKGDKMVIVENINKRDKLLRINKEDLVVTVANKIDSFEDAYFRLFEKVLSIILNPSPAIYKKQSKIEMERTKVYLLAHMFGFFKQMMDDYTDKLIFKWSLEISDKNYVGRLQIMTLRRLSNMFAKRTGLHRKKKPNIDWVLKRVGNQLSFDEFLSSYLIARRSGRIPITDVMKDFEAYNLKEEAEDLLNKI